MFLTLGIFTTEGNLKKIIIITAQVNLLHCQPTIVTTNYEQNALYGLAPLLMTDIKVIPMIMCVYYEITAFYDINETIMSCMSFMFWMSLQGRLK